MGMLTGREAEWYMEPTADEMERDWNRAHGYPAWPLCEECVHHVWSDEYGCPWCEMHDLELNEDSTPYSEYECEDYRIC